MSQLRGAPLLHRALHRVGSRGFAGAPTLWRAASAVRPLPSFGRWSPAPGVELPLTLTRDQLAEEALYHGTFEWAERKIVAGLVKPGDLCVDIGANIGIYTALLAGLVGPTGRVVACEPSPVALTRLRQLDHPSVQILPIAIGAAQDQAEMVVAPGDSMHSTLRRDHQPEGERETVTVRPLTELVDSADFVKVDVEGFEAQVLQGMTPLLETQRIRAVMLEVEPAYGSTEWVDVLSRLRGYRLSHLTVGRRLLRWRPSLVPVDGFQGPGTVFLTRT